jgi:hypothetical protein
MFTVLVARGRGETIMTTFIANAFINTDVTLPAYDSLSSETWLTIWSNIHGESSYSELRIAIAYAAEKK